MMLLLVAIASAGAGFGVFLIVRGLVPSPRPLSVIAAELRQPAGQVQPQRRDLLLRAVTGHLTSTPSPARTANLAVTGSSMERHVIAKLVGVAAGVGLAAATGALMTVAGGSGSFTAAAGVAIVFGAMGWVYPDYRLRRAATVARAGWSHALTVYVDVIAICLAGGAGVEDAMLDAASIGSGPELHQIAVTLGEATTRRLKLWDALEDLASRFDLPVLRELASTAALAGDSGSRVRDTLVAKAKGLRVRQLAETETAAAKATETMGIAPAFMALAVVALIGYPAIARFAQ